VFTITGVQPSTISHNRMTATLNPPKTRRRTGAARRLLASPLVDLLVGPHGIDRYLELINPNMTITDARAEIVKVQRQTPRSVTLTIRPNKAWAGFTAGQFIRVGVEIDGVRRTRTYSPASSQHLANDLLELTISFLPDGLVSSYLRAENPGGVVHLGTADGDFMLPDERPDKLVLISGGSGVTPVMSMLRTLLDEGHQGEITFIHYARTQAEWLYHDAAQRLAAEHANLNVEYVATREGGAHFGPDTLSDSATPSDTHVAVCGPRTLIEAVHEAWADAPENFHSESFSPPSLQLSGEAAEGTLRFLTSNTTAEITPGTILEQAEAAGLTPEHGCRMGICHSCTCRKTAGTVKNILTGEVSSEEDEDIQICIHVPAGDVALAI
jgi:stearoyl-CoA 9-desaturase NADPH oxidoreductase